MDDREANGAVGRAPSARGGSTLSGCGITLLLLPFRLLAFMLTWPIRLLAFGIDRYRRRISIQLISSHVLVVLLTSFLVGAMGLTVTLGVIDVFNGNPFSDPSAEFQGRAITLADALGPDDIARLSQPSTADEAKRSMDAALTRVVQGDPVHPRGQTEPMIEHAIVVDPSGTILASSDDQWVAAGSNVRALSSAQFVGVVNRAIQLNGGRTAYGNRYVYDSGVTEQVAAYPILLGGQAVAVVGIQGSVPWAPSSPRIEISQIALSALLGGILGIVVVSIPALLVSIPIGIWRARAVSKRLANLAESADAMAQGELDRRIEVRGRDEISRLSERFNKMSQGLAEADMARKAFVANVSHELRTPLAIIQGSVERMRTRSAQTVPAALPASQPAGEAAGADRPPDRQEELLVIEQEVATLRRLVDDLFTMARIEETVLRFEPAPVDLNQLAAESVDGIRGLAWDQRKVTVKSMVTPGLPQVLADRTRLKQIFGNLLHNALRHTPEGGLIVVAAERAGDMVETTISDTGVGIPADELDRIFQRFYQATSRIQEGDAGGLGLAIVKQLVEAQGGTIEVESVPDEGTTFRFKLPIAQ